MSMKRANQIITAGLNSTKSQAVRNRIENIVLTSGGYVEPGYTNPESGVVALGNWNEPRDVPGGMSLDEAVDYVKENPRRPGVLSRIARALEKIGVALEWSDEWVECDRCFSVFRTQPDSYSWQMSGVINDGEAVCRECIDPEEHFEALEGSTTNCNVVPSLKPGEHGYLLIEDEFEHGFHRGQAASPKLIGEALTKAGVERFVFNIDDKGQFDMRFSVWLHEEEKDKLEAAKQALEDNGTDGPEPAAAMERNLREASAQMSKLEGEGITVASVSPDGVEVKKISAQDFIDGKIK